jgi:predicted Zn-dependent peptidase
MMRNLRLMALVLAICILPSVAAGQTLEEKVTEFTLRNGMTFIVVERHVAPVVFCATLFNVGSIDERDGLTGVSHMLEHMMFKGTKTVGTVSYSKEKRYLAEEDEIADSISDLKSGIGAWRLEIFDDFSRSMISMLDEETKQEIGGDRGKELAVLISTLESGERIPPGSKEKPTLLEENGIDYFARYMDLKRKELELWQVMAEHRRLIITEELWDAYLENGGRMLNAFTSNDLTAYYVYLPANRLELWMMLESDRMKDPVFREFYSERDVVAEEKRLDENDPGEALWDALMAAAFQASPYRRPVLGWMSDIQDMTRQDLISHFERFYGPNNATAVLVGDVDVPSARRMAERYFARIPAREVPDPVETVEPEQKGERRVTVEFPANPQVFIAYHVPVAPNPDSYPVQVLASILGDGRTSRLYKRLYEDLKLTSQPPGVSTEPGERLDNLLVIQATPRQPHTAEEVEEAIYKEIRELRIEPPTAREVHRVKNRIDAAMVRTLGSNLGMAFYVGSSAVVRGDWRAYLDDREKMKAVKRQDVLAAARKYLIPENRTVATLVKEEEGEQEEDLEIDRTALITWIRSLPEEEGKAIFARLRDLSKEERKEYARELWKRAQAASGQKEGDDGAEKAQ